MDESLHPTVRSLLGDVCPDREVREIRPAGISWNEQNETVRVAFEAGDHLYVKLAVDGDGSRIARERAVIDYVRANCDVAVPSVIASAPTGDPPYLITAPMDGRNLVEGWSDRREADQARIARQVGAALATLHAQAFDHHGDIVDGGANDLVLDTGTWTEILSRWIRVTGERASMGRFDRYVDEVVAALDANRDRLDDAPARLLHGDPAHPNLFQCDATIGAVDWELAHVGDPARELHRAYEQFLYDDPARLKPALHEGYTARARSLPDGLADRAPIYDAVWHLEKLSVFDKWAETDDRSREAAASAAEAEMKRYLAAIR